MNINDEWIGTLLLAVLNEMYAPMIIAVKSSGVKICLVLIKTNTQALFKNKNHNFKSKKEVFESEK